MVDAIATRQPCAPTADATVFVGRVVAPERIIADGAVVTVSDRIVWVGHRAAAADAGWGEAVAAVGEPAPGRVVLPGLVDIHNHGGGGVSFSSARTVAEVRVGVREHLTHGTTSLVTSLMTAERETLLARTVTLAELADAGHTAGIHLEGPFLSTVRCGAQDPAGMLDGDPGFVRAVAAAARGHLRIMTVAPEVPGVTEPGGVIETLVEVGALPSIGHTDASAEETEAAVAVASNALAAAGRPETRITATHLFNAMRPAHHRDPGPVVACLAAAARGRLVVELIADGTHLAPATVRGVVDLVGVKAAADAGPAVRGGGVSGPDAVVLVTDATAAAGRGDGIYELGSARVAVAGGVARLTDGGAIAGGTGHLLDVVRETVAAGVPLLVAVRAASTTPASVVGLDDVGGLVPGLRADILVTDADLRPVDVIRAGRRVG